MWQAKLSEGGKNLVLTVCGAQSLTVEQASQLTLPEFGKLWKVCMPSLCKQTSASQQFCHNSDLSGQCAFPSECLSVFSLAELFHL